MSIRMIINDLMNNHIIHSEPIEYRQLKGGTVSEVYLLKVDGTEYVVKLNDREVIESEVLFLDHYKGIKLLPDILFVEPAYKYIVYPFINGFTNYSRKNKKEVLQSLAKGLINYYKPAPKNIGWGWVNQPADSWRHFQLNEVAFARQVIVSRLETEDHHFVHNLVKNSSFDKTAFLLHGDCGIHNFIFNGNQLNGVIDPTPVIGNPIYDLIYAFCSSPDDLTKETIDAGIKHLVVNSEINRSDLYEQVIIGLYIRLETCITHYPNDFEAYLKAWYYWKGLIKNV